MTAHGDPLKEGEAKLLLKEHQEPRPGQGYKHARQGKKPEGSKKASVERANAVASTGPKTSESLSSEAQK